MEQYTMILTGILNVSIIVCLIWKFNTAPRAQLIFASFFLGWNMHILLTYLTK